MLRMQKADTPELARAEGIAIAQEMLCEARGMIQGVQVSAPFGRYPPGGRNIECDRAVRGRVIEDEIGRD